MTIPETVQFEIDGIPPSLNSSHRFYPGGVRGRIRKYPVASFTEWMQLVSLTQKQKKIKEATFYSLEFEFYMPTFCKNGSVRRIDCSNLIKYAEDAVLKLVVDSNGKLIDDSRIVEITAEKIDSDKEKTVIVLSALL